MKSKRALTIKDVIVVTCCALFLLMSLGAVNRGGRRRAKLRLCAANLRNVGQAWRLFVDDNDGRTHNSPNRYGWDGLEPDDRYAYWGVAYNQYANEKRIFRCPSARIQSLSLYLYDSEDISCSAYGLNGYTSNRDVSLFTNQAKIIIAQDHVEPRLEDGGDMFHIRPPDTVNLSHYREGGSRAYWFVEIFRHYGLSNTLWMDGHVSPIAESTGEDVPIAWYDPLELGDPGSLPN